MLVTEFFAHLSRLTYFLIAVITLADFLRHRDRTRLDIALAFLVPAVNVLVQVYGLFIGPPPLMSFVSQFMLMAQPHMLLRLVTHFRPVAPRVLWVSTLGLALSVLLLALPLVFPALGLPAPSVLFLVAYFAWAEGYASVAFIRGALGTAGVSRWRYGFAALGAVLFAAVIVVAGLLSLVPVLADYAQPVSLLMGLISGLAFLLAFAPPRRVRQFWQYAELHHFLMRASGRPVRDRAGHILPVLCDMAQRALGGRAAVAALDSGQPDQLTVRAATLPALEGMPLNLTRPGPLFTAWHGRQPVAGNQRHELSPAGLQLLDAVGGDALCAVPIATPERAWGVLVVLLMRRSLFPDDDLELMRLMAEQAAATLDQNILLHEQDELIGHLRERTAQLEAANQELEAFSYSVSHDLRAPLRHVEGFTDLLLRSDPAEPQRRQHLQRISDAAVRMGRLIDSLLTFSRLGRTELRRLPVQLSQALAEAQQDLSSETYGRAVEWLVQPLPEVAGDPDLLRQVFVNLLSNALKYSRGRDPARIAVGVEPSTAPEVIVSVRDNGVGFDMEYGDKLFGVFQRLHHAEEFEGVGIGLANVRRIIHRHGGRVWAAGQVDGGATFYFALPRAAPARPEAVPNPLPAVPAPLDPLAPGGVSPHA